jgi:ribosome recycling factor
MSGTVEERMGRALEAFGKDLGGFRTGRASASLVEHITVDHYGAKTPLNQMAGISVPENTLLVVQLRVPSMTEERRKDLVKQMGKRTEEARIEIRSARRDEQEAIKKMEKNKEIGEDDARRRLEALQKATDAKTAEIDRMAASKEREVLEG